LIAQLRQRYCAAMHFSLSPNQHRMGKIRADHAGPIAERNGNGQIAVRNKVEHAGFGVSENRAKSLCHADAPQAV